MKIEDVTQNKKRYTDLKQFIEDKTRSGQAKKDLSIKTYLMAAGLYMLYEEISCFQYLEADKIDKQTVYKDDIFFHYYNLYKPYFTGKKMLLFDPDNDIGDNTVCTQILKAFNYIAYELDTNNPYAKAMMKQLYKIFYYDVWLHLKDLKQVNVEDLIDLIRYVDRNETTLEVESIEDEAQNTVEKLFIIYLFTRVADIDVMADPDPESPSGKVFSEIIRASMMIYAHKISEYRKVVPEWMKEAPDRDSYIAAVENDENDRYLDKIIKRFDIDTGKKSFGLPLYNRLKRLERRVFYYNGYDADRAAYVPTEYFEMDEVNFRQAYFYLSWMLGGDESKITKEQFEAAAAVMNIVNCYIDHIHHYTSNIDTLMRVEESSSVARTYLESLHDASDPRIQQLETESKEKDKRIKQLEDQLNALKSEAAHNKAVLQREQEKNTELSKQVSDTIDWQQLDSLYAGQIREQAEMITSLQTEITALNSRILDLQRDNETLQEINTTVTKEALKSWRAAPGREEKILAYGKEKEFYDEEIKEMILDAIDEYARTSVIKGSRREDILMDILNANDYKGVIKERRARLKKILSNNALKNAVASSVVRDLQGQGFTLVSESNHIKMQFFSDPRYTITMAKTSSDSRAADNVYAAVKKLCY